MLGKKQHHKRRCRQHALPFKQRFYNFETDIPALESGTKRKLNAHSSPEAKRPKPNPTFSEAIKITPSEFEPPTVEEFLTRLAAKRKNNKFKEAADILNKEGTSPTCNFNIVFVKGWTFYQSSFVLLMMYEILGFRGTEFNHNGIFFQRGWGSF